MPKRAVPPTQRSLPIWTQRVASCACSAEAIAADAASSVASVLLLANPSADCRYALTLMLFCGPSLLLIAGSVADMQAGLELQRACGLLAGRAVVHQRRVPFALAVAADGRCRVEECFSGPRTDAVVVPFVLRKASGKIFTVALICSRDSPITY